MRRQLFPSFSKRWVLSLLVLGLACIGLYVGTATTSASASGSSSVTIARGGGTTIIQGGTGSTGGFIPIVTTLAFHAERVGGTVTGALDCLARTPEANTGALSAQFTVNAMYVTGQVTGATVSGNTVTLTGTASITGLGAGSNVSFTMVVQRGGPGATAVLTVNTLPGVSFNEVLVEGSFHIFAS